MKMPFKPAIILASCTLVLLAGCASTGPVPYTNLSSAPQLKSNAKKDDDQTPYLYSSSPDWRAYSAVIIEPVEVYQGPDNQFDDLPKEDRLELARYMDTEFKKALGQRFTIADRAGPNTLRLKLTLTGAETNTALVSTFTRFDLVGLPYNAVQGIRGKEGIFMGSVSYSVEVHDAASNKLLLAYVTKQHPNAMNIAATFGSLHAAKTGIEKGAEELVARLR